jgi:hypothetical protein
VQVLLEAMRSDGDSDTVASDWTASDWTFCELVQFEGDARQVGSDASRAPTTKRWNQV